MKRIVKDQVAHSYGVIDPQAIERRDTKFLQAALSDANNVILLPQGGYSDRGGTYRAGLARLALDEVAVVVGYLTAPNGGALADLIDSDTASVFETNVVAGDPFVVFTLTFPAAREVTFFDLTEFLAGGDRDDCLQVQYFDGAWQDFGQPVNLRTEKRTRRFAIAPDLPPVVAAQWRVVVTGGAGVEAVSIANIQVFAENGTLSPGRVRQYDKSFVDFYDLVLTTGNVDIYKGEVWQGAAAMPSTAEMVPLIKVTGSYDTVLFFCEDMTSWRLQRQGSDSEWNSDAAPFENIPRVDYGGVYNNGINEVQRLLFVSFSPSHTFALSLEGVQTDDIVYEGTPAATSANIKSALEALSNVDAGITVTNQAGTYHWEVEFSGGDNAARDWEEMSAYAVAFDTSILVSTKIKGKAAGEDLFSATQGFASVGRYASERLLLAGFKERPSNVLPSKTGSPYNLDVETSVATGAFLFGLSDDGVGTVRDILVKRGLLFFADGGVWSMSNTKLSADETPDLARSDAPGIAAGIAPVSIENVIFYVQRGGNNLKQISYTEVERNFVDENAAMLASFLVNGVSDMAASKGGTANEANNLWLVNNDGELVTVTLMRAQDVSGFAPHTTTGKFVSVCARPDETIVFLCERTIGGVQRLVYEPMRRDGFLDCAQYFTFGAPTAVVSGLEDYEGQSLYFIGDDVPLGFLTVDSGQVTLPVAVSAGQYGYWIAPHATDVKYLPEEDSEQVEAEMKRVFDLKLSLLETTSVAAIVNGNPVHNFPLEKYDIDNLSTPRMTRPFTGEVHVEGMPGFTRTAQTTVTQLFPGRLKVLGVTKGIAI